MHPAAVMYPHWNTNVLVVLAAGLAVCAVVLVHYEGLSLLSRWLTRRHRSRRRRKVLHAIFGVMALHITHIWIFGFTVWGLLHLPSTGSVSGMHPIDLLDAVYLAATSYTTLGFGDLAPVGPIRFLPGIMALTGFVLITWSASFTYLEMSRDWGEQQG